MISGEEGYKLDRADAERVWTGHVATAAGERWHQRYLGRHVIPEFLDSVSVADPSGGQQLVIDRQRVLSWMIQDVAGKALAYAAERLAVLGRFLQMLAQAGLIGSGMLAAYRAGPGRQSWRCLARALRTENPEAALTALQLTPPPPGPLAAHLRSYVELQQALGKDYRVQNSALRDLDQFLHARGVASPQAATPVLIEGWIDTLTCGARSRVHKARFARRFFDYLRGLGVVTINPVPCLLTSPHRLPPSSFKPFLFTQQQLRDILAEARRLPDHHMCFRRAEICATMLTLLCTLGLRHGEVRRLRIRHLDLVRQTVFIEQTKFHKSRYVPFGPKVGQCLKQYLDVRRTLLQPVQEDDLLFVTKWRKPICPKMLLDVFRDILGRLGITGIEGQPPPRLHDVRHAFAVNRLLRWYRDGVDVQARLPALATFLGHVSPQSTEVYLTITADLLREANARFHRHFGSVFDEERQR
jgi:integrase